MSTHGSSPDGLRLGGAIASLDRSTQFVERPVRRLSGPDRLNPMVHAGTISVFLLGIVVVTGLYITLFFEFGFAASYDSVAAMEEHPIQRLMRAIHRYSSAALVVTTLVHGWKVFTSRRFVGPRRRWRWASGITSLTLVWLAGVTGYWLVWDRRAAAISEALAQLLQPTGAGSRFAVRNLIGVSPGSGSGLLLVIWFAHIILTIVIGWFMYRHLRRSKQPWFPPRGWMIVMGLSLLLAALVVPVDMLGPARPDQLVADMPLDPFVLFLLPPLLSSWRWVALAAMIMVPLVVALVPRLLRRSDPAVIQIDDDACTGCELCVIDCPYDALSMSAVPEHEHAIAVLDADQCVACGICVGSCAFDAIELPGGSAVRYKPALSTDAPGPPAGLLEARPRGRDISVAHLSAESPPTEIAAREVVVICDRHDPQLVEADDVVVVAVRCAGMFAPNAVRAYADRGAANLHLIGCAPSDCRYGTGNTLAAERFAGSRAPHPPRKFADRIATDFVASDQVGWARTHQSQSAARDPSDPRRYAAVGLLVLLSVGGVVAATAAPFRSGEGARVRAVVDHRAESALLEHGASVGLIEQVELVADGQIVGRRAIANNGVSSVGFADWDMPAVPTDLELRAIVDGEPIVLASGRFELTDRQQLLLTATDVPLAPGSDDGRDVFTSRSAGCTICHATGEGRDGVGPSLYGVGSSAGDRVDGLTAELYLRQSILLPDQHVVEGWPAGQMLPIYRERLDEQQLEALITYLLTLTTAGGS